jgi:hypothetical protein
MDLNGMPVHHGPATMADLGLAGVMPFDRFDRWGMEESSPRVKRSKQRQW